MSFEYVISQLMGTIPVEAGEPDPEFPDWTGKTAVFMGDSITRGYNASPITTNRWTRKLVDALGGTEDNFGVDGMTLQSGCVATFNQTSIPSYNSSIHVGLFIGLGTNDIGQNNGTGKTAAAYQTLLESAVDYAHATKGWPFNLIYVSTPYYCLSYAAYIGSCSVSVAATQGLADDYEDAALAAAAAKGVNGINIRQLMVADGFNSSHYNADNVHPNNAGYLKIANLYKNALAL